MLFTVLGTLTHEYGHYAAANHFGYKTRINYMSTSYVNQPGYDKIIALNDDCIKRKKNDPGASCKELDTAIKNSFEHSVVIRSAGPLQTMLTGTTGLLLLTCFGRSFNRSEKLKVWQWSFILITLFWLRQVFNFILSSWSYFMYDHLGNSDEIDLALMFNLPPLSVTFCTFLAGSFVFSIVFFRFIPPFQRLTFLCGGLAGGIFGFYLWFEHVGPWILP